MGWLEYCLDLNKAKILLIQGLMTLQVVRE